MHPGTPPPGGASLPDRIFYWCGICGVPAVLLALAMVDWGSAFLLLLAVLWAL